MIKAFIQRRFKEPPLPENLQAINELRVQAMAQKGYVSGETLVNLADNRQVTVVSVWSSLADWEEWFQSRQRKVLCNALSPHLADRPEISLFMMGADYLEVAFAQYLHDADAVA